jgi:hypothetical protein
MVRMQVLTSIDIAREGAALTATLQLAGRALPITALEAGRTVTEQGVLTAQSFMLYQRSAVITRSRFEQMATTEGCVKFKLSRMQQRPAFPIHVAPTVLEDGRRKTISYREAIARLADLVLEHAAPMAESSSMRVVRSTTSRSSRCKRCFACSAFET